MMMMIILKQFTWRSNMARVIKLMPEGAPLTIVHWFYPYRSFKLSNWWRHKWGRT